MFLDDALIEGLEQNQDFISLLLINGEIKHQLLVIFTEKIYKSLCEEKSIIRNGEGRQMNDDRMTHKEHIVPKVYLKGFSPDKKSVYSYEIKMSQPTNRLVPVSSICFTKDYYELIDENGNYMLPNHMENLMSDIETSFMMHRALLERKVFISANQYCSSILSKEEKEFWILYVAIQMMRTKLGVDLYTSYLSDYSENFSKIMIRNLALVSCTPSFATFLASDKTPLPVLFRKLNEGFVSFGVTNKNVLWTSDLPVFTFKSNTDVDPDYRNIMFPVTSRILLFLFAGRDEYSAPN